MLTQQTFMVVRSWMPLKNTAANTMCYSSTYLQSKVELTNVLGRYFGNPLVYPNKAQLRKKKTRHSREDYSIR